MTLTIRLDEKSKQVIKLSDKFAEKHKTYGEQYQAAQGIAKDIARGNYIDFEISQ